MAKLKIASVLIEDMIFGSSKNPVYITGVEYDKDTNVLIFNLNGKDILDCEEVEAEISVEINRVHSERLTKMNFVKIK